MFLPEINCFKKFFDPENKYLAKKKLFKPKQLATRHSPKIIFDQKNGFDPKQN